MEVRDGVGEVGNGEIMVNMVGRDEDGVGVVGKNGVGRVGGEGGEVVEGRV